jgi:hypothetical protein
MANSGLTRNEGLKTPINQSLSSGQYSNYVNYYNSKPAASSGPANRQSVAYNGTRGN